MSKKKQTTFDSDVKEVALKLFEAFDTPRSLMVAILIKHEEWDQIAKLRIDPMHYLDGSLGYHKYKRDYQATELLRKYQGLPCTIDKKAVAIDGFWATEAQCKQTNDRLDSFLFSPVFDGHEEERIWCFIQRVKKRISTVLGPVPKTIDPKFGPGAIFESKGHKYARRLTLGDKLLMEPAVTREALDIFKHFFEPSAWGRARYGKDGYLLDSSASIKIVRGNRFTTVPKDSTKDRGICIEAGANVWLQLGVGGYIRSRLQKVWGLLLDEGKSERLHRHLACVGSLNGNYATIDLSSASDTVALKLVKLLLPGDWFDLLSTLRSPFTQVNGKWVRLEKFSSMGNGFTFELETLIFAAIAKVACGDEDWDVTVYGDDIIVPSQHAREVLAALTYFGFTPNPRKTFSTGLFRESCGGDFFSGRAVRPYHIEEVPNEARHWISIANGLYRASGFYAHTRSSPYFRARFTALGKLPKQIRECIGPIELGDILVHDVERRWRYVIRNSQRCFRVWRPVSRIQVEKEGRTFWIDKRVNVNRFPAEIQVALALVGAPDCGSSGNGTPYLTPRNAVAGHRFGRVKFS